MPRNQPQELDLTFRPRARLLQLLGDQLIGSPRLAVFELVKNAYDADAGSVHVEIRDLQAEEATISVCDDGVGMSLETIRDIWLVPAHDHRERQRLEGIRTAKHRLPLGEKGLGRFAAHKLGDRINLVTRAADHAECVLAIDWSRLIQQRDLSDAVVRVLERPPTVFEGDSTGTVLTITKLRQDWSRGEIRRLHRQMTSISSPFHTRDDDFQATLSVPGHRDWLQDLPDISVLLRRAPWRYRFRFEDGVFKWNYQFRRIPGFDAQNRRVSGDAPLLISPGDIEDDEGRVRRARPVVAQSALAEGIGPVRGNIFVFDRDREVLSRQGDTRLMESFLDLNGGIRVYRDGIRVYNYGEPSDDWLDLDLSRVNDPTLRISRNIVLGAIDLSLEESTDLREKTNREGFVENPAFRRFRAIVRGALTPLTVERKQDKDRIRLLAARRPPEDGTDHSADPPAP